MSDISKKNILLSLGYIRVSFFKCLLFVALPAFRLLTFSYAGFWFITTYLCPCPLPPPKLNGTYPSVQQRSSAVTNWMVGIRLAIREINSFISPQLPRVPLASNTGGFLAFVSSR